MSRFDFRSWTRTLKVVCLFFVFVYPHGLFKAALGINKSQQSSREVHDVCRGLEVEGFSNHMTLAASAPVLYNDATCVSMAWTLQRTEGQQWDSISPFSSSSRRCCLAKV